MKLCTETIDKLFLELSQFTQAKTAREIELENQIKSLPISDFEKPGKNEYVFRDEAGIVGCTSGNSIMHAVQKMQKLFPKTDFIGVELKR